MNEIKRLIAAERRSTLRYTLMLLLDWRATRAERARWQALKRYHAAQLERWKAKL